MSFAPLEDGLLFYTSGFLLCRFERILGFWVWFVALSCGHSRHCELKLGITFWGMMGEGTGEGVGFAMQGWARSR